MEKHETNVADLKKQLKNQPRAKVSLAKGKTNSNTTRDAAYKKETVSLDISGFNRVLDVDTEQKIVVVEPRVSMLELVHKTLQFGLIPKVVPEFMGITVGGAINGCGGESSSYTCGLLHDTALSYEVLLGNGECIIATPSEHSDLFHALHGAYGSLGIVLSAKFPLMPAKKYVRLQYHWFSDPKRAISHIRSRPQVDFIEGIIFSKERAVVIEGNLTDIAHAPLFCFSSASTPWFYQHVQKQTQDICMPLVDYIFRYDRGAFWMGAYVLRASFFLDFLLKRPISSKRYDVISGPNAIVRAFSKPVMGSQKLYKLLHTGEKWIQDHVIIQDFTFPETTVEAFLEDVFDLCPLFPLWVCPIKSAHTTQLFSPAATNSSDLLHINIGIYGVPDSAQPIKKILQDLEMRTTFHKGRKWFYTNSEYTRQDFWRIYDEQMYQRVRKKYYAENIFLNIDEKVLQ